MFFCTRTIRLAVAWCFWGVVSVVFCAPGLAVGQEAAPLPVAVSIAPQQYFVEAIGGPDVAVTVLADKGRDPHVYEPTASQMATVGKAALYFAVGVPFESVWLPRFQALNKNMAVVRHTDAVPRLAGKPDLALRSASAAAHHGHEGHGLETDDPHLWLSPRAVLQFIPQIAEALSQARPEKKAAFMTRAEALTKEVTALDAELAALFAALPPDKRTFLTFHQGWAYFADNYGLREASVELQGKEPGPRSMAALLDFAAREHIRVIVADPLAPKNSVAAVAAQIKAQVIPAFPFASDWPEATRRFASALAAGLNRK